MGTAIEAKAYKQQLEDRRWYVRRSLTLEAGDIKAINKNVSYPVAILIRRCV